MNPKSLKNDRLYLSSMLESIERIESYTQKGVTDFWNSTLIQDGVIRNLEILGEATKRLSDELRRENPQIAWKQIAGMRDVLIHDYLKVELSQVWEVVEANLPLLKTTVINLLQALEE
jgi:uncharacterized protein with HEPN domain